MKWGGNVRKAGGEGKRERWAGRRGGVEVDLKRKEIS